MILYNAQIFARQVGWKLGILFIMMLGAAIAEGFGVSMILPLLQSDISESDDILSKIIVGLFDRLGLFPSGTNILILLVVFFILRGGLLIGQAWFQAIILSDHLMNMRSELIKLVLNAKYTHITQYPSGYLTNAVVGESRNVGDGLRSLIDLIVALITASVYLALPIMLQPTVTVLLIVLAIPIGIMTAFLIRSTKSASIELTRGHGKQESSLVEGFRYSKFVKSTGRVTTMANRLTEVASQVSSSYRKMLILGSLTRYAPEPLVVFVMAGIILVYTRVYNEPITEIMFLMFLFYQATKNILRTQSSLRTFVETSGGLLVHQNLRENLSKNTVKSQVENPDPDIESDIHLKGVSLFYDGETTPALNKVDIQIPHSKTVAVVGASGSGKTSVANIISGLIEPSEGMVMIGGQPYQSINLNTLQQNIGYVTQESAVFNGTLAENISFWDEHPNHNKIRALLDKVELNFDADDANTILYRKVGGDGAQLSGGERQRLSIARELYRESKILILDEATSALDSNLEQKIDELIKNERGNRTFLIIAHRLSTVRNADNIYVLDKGEVVEEGPFDTLMKKNRLFANMVKRQSF